MREILVANLKTPSSLQMEDKQQELKFYKDLELI